MCRQRRLGPQLEKRVRKYPDERFQMGARLTSFLLFIDRWHGHVLPFLERVVLLEMAPVPDEIECCNAVSQSPTCPMILSETTQEFWPKCANWCRI